MCQNNFLNLISSMNNIIYIALRAVDKINYKNAHRFAIRRTSLIIKKQAGISSCFVTSVLLSRVNWQLIPIKQGWQTECRGRLERGRLK